MWSRSYPPNASVPDSFFQQSILLKPISWLYAVLLGDIMLVVFLINQKDYELIFYILKSYFALLRTAFVKSVVCFNTPVGFARNDAERLVFATGRLLRFLLIGGCKSL